MSKNGAVFKFTLQHKDEVSFLDETLSVANIYIGLGIVMIKIIIICSILSKYAVF